MGNYVIVEAPFPIFKPPCLVRSQNLHNHPDDGSLLHSACLVHQKEYAATESPSVKCCARRGQTRNELDRMWSISAVFTCLQEMRVQSVCAVDFRINYKKNRIWGL